jgi:hypothetical protein
MKKIYYIHVLAVLLFLLPAKSKSQSIKPADFAGSWAIDYSQSSFGNIPHYAASKNIQYSLSGKYINLKLTMDTPEGIDTVDNKKLAINNNTIDLSEPDKQKRNITVKFYNNKLLIKSVASIPGDTSTVQYQVSEEWSLSGDGKTLSIDRKVSTPTEPEQYHIIAVYKKD